MGGAKVGVFKEIDNCGFASLLKCDECRCLEPIHMSIFLLILV
jgi:hypothetical protein